MNQARNLASLPYSSLAQLEQQITQTQQLLAQAQRIAYSVTALHDLVNVTAGAIQAHFERLQKYHKELLGLATEVEGDNGDE